MSALEIGNYKKKWIESSYDFALPDEVADMYTM